MKPITIKALQTYFGGNGYILSSDDLDYIVALINEDKTVGWSVDMKNRMYFTLKNGEQISLSSTDSAFVYVMRQQPVEFRIRAMDLTLDEMEIYISEVRNELIQELKKVIFSKKIKSRETGEKYNFLDGYANMQYYELEKELTGKQIISAVQKKEISVGKGFKILRMILEETYI